MNLAEISVIVITYLPFCLINCCFYGFESIINMFFYHFLAARIVTCFMNYITQLSSKLQQINKLCVFFNYLLLSQSARILFIHFIPFLLHLVLFTGSFLLMPDLLSHFFCVYVLTLSTSGLFIHFYTFSYTIFLAFPSSSKNQAQNAPNTRQIRNMPYNLCFFCSF